MVCFFEVFSAMVKRPEDTLVATGFSPLSSVGGLSLLEAHPCFVWLSPCKPPVVLRFMIHFESVTDNK
ncbi:unnamed protein product [Brassica rapa subsp. trilocularis]